MQGLLGQMMGMGGGPAGPRGGIGGMPGGPPGGMQSPMPPPGGPPSGQPGGHVMAAGAQPPFLLDLKRQCEAGNTEACAQLMEWHQQKRGLENFAQENTMPNMGFHSRR